jgi:hypothetical protein
LANVEISDKRIFIAKKETDELKSMNRFQKEFNSSLTKKERK